MLQPFRIFSGCCDNCKDTFFSGIEILAREGLIRDIGLQ